MDALWMVINPMQQRTVLNATVYDVLVLLIYRINLTVQQMTDLLGDFIYKLYVEKM